MTIPCPHCQRRNDVPLRAEAGDPLCGACGARLRNGALTWALDCRFSLLLGCLLALLVWAARSDSSGKAPAPGIANTDVQSTSGPESVEAIDTALGLTGTANPAANVTARNAGDDQPNASSSQRAEAPPTPAEGVIRVYSGAPRLAPFRIKTAPFGGNYFVKLVDADSGAAVMTMFISGGSTFETHVPLGAMRLRYASGSAWQGEAQLFGNETTFSQADQTFEFARESDGYTGFTVELVPRAGGNLRTNSIPRDQF